jgi:hypothetical protein
MLAYIPGKNLFITNNKQNISIFPFISLSVSSIIWPYVFAKKEDSRQQKT